MSDELLVYPRRDYGMDHDRYEWSMLQDRPPVAWPDGKPLALWINLSLQHFPLSGDKPLCGTTGSAHHALPRSQALHACGTMAIGWAFTGCSS